MTFPFPWIAHAARRKSVRKVRRWGTTLPRIPPAYFLKEYCHVLSCRHKIDRRKEDAICVVAAAAAGAAVAVAGFGMVLSGVAAAARSATVTSSNLT